MKINKKKLIITAIILLIIIILDCWGFSMKTEYYTVESGKVDTPIRIVFISDLHNCFYGGFDQSGIIDAIEEAQPDIVLFGGDIVSKTGGMKNAETLLRAISEKYPCAYASGNHEEMRSDKSDVLKMIDGAGVKVLNGQSTDLEIKGKNVHISGIVEPFIYSDQLENVYKDIKPESYNILLGHEPEFWGTYIIKSMQTGKSFDLILSGHDHGGQWRLPIILEQGLYAPDQGFFPEFTNGQREENGTVQIVSRGLARQLNMIFIPRIFNRPEFSVIDIT
jgi:hypothetical protein